VGRLLVRGTLTDGMKGSSVCAVSVASLAIHALVLAINARFHGFTPNGKYF